MAYNSPRNRHDLCAIEHTPAAHAHHGRYIVLGSKRAATLYVFEMGFRWNVLIGYNFAASGSQDSFDGSRDTGRHQPGIGYQEHTLTRVRPHKFRKSAIDSGAKVNGLRNSKGECLRHA